MNKRVDFPRGTVLLEVGLVFMLALLLFRGVHALPLAARLQAAAGGYLMAEYAVLLLLTGGLYAWVARCWPTERPPLRYQFRIFGRGFFPVLGLSIGLSWIDWSSWCGSLLVGLLGLGLLLWLGWWVREIRPGVGPTAVGGGLLMLPVLAQLAAPLAPSLLAFGYFYILVAGSEELLFRGYIQERLNAAFGHPYRFFGTPWGWGLVVSGLLFGLWHLGWQVGRLSGPHAVWTLAAGLLFGLLREKSGGLLVPIVLHGVLNFGPQAFGLLWWGGG